MDKLALETQVRLTSKLVPFPLLPMVTEHWEVVRGLTRLRSLGGWVCGK